MTKTKITIVRILRFGSIGGIRDDDGRSNLCGTFIELAHICQDERLKEAPTMFKPIFETESKPNLAFLRSMFFRCVIFISMISLISSTLNLVFGIGQILMKVHFLIGEELLHDKRLVAGTIAISVQVLLSQSFP